MTRYNNYNVIGKDDITITGHETLSDAIASLVIERTCNLNGLAYIVDRDNVLVPQSEWYTILHSLLYRK